MTCSLPRAVVPSMQPQSAIQRTGTVAIISHTQLLRMDWDILISPIQSICFKTRDRGQTARSTTNPRLRNVALKALMDCLVAISACPFDQEIDGKRINHPRCTPLRVEFVPR